MTAFAGILCLGLILVPLQAFAKYASIVIDAKTGQVLHQVNADTRNYPASLTKMMTLYMTFEALSDGRLKLDQKLVVSRTAAGRSPSKLGLRRGEKIKVHDIILALVTKSANDAATVMAEAIGGSERRFARMMTVKAREIGMDNTTFRNASGLPNRRQLTTARDMAILSRALYLDYPQHYHHFSTRKFTYKGLTHKNHNKLLGRYKGIDGIKTGYIRASGFNLAASIERKGRRLISVVMGGRSPRSRDRHVMSLLERAFARLEGGDTVAAAPAVAKKTVKRRFRKNHTNGVVMVPPRKPTVDEKTYFSVMASLPPVKRRRWRAWSIEVGAYPRFAPAHLAITRAAVKAPRLLRRGRVVILPIKVKNGATLYRARIVGLSKRRAHRACKYLRRKDIACNPVRPDGSVDVAKSRTKKRRATKRR
ncbi:MAG: D-alanyl-D-alanine carboxypeptidase family protein [Alphaproteobacteria bacterium]